MKKTFNVRALFQGGGEVNLFIDLIDTEESIMKVAKDAMQHELAVFWLGHHLFKNVVFFHVRECERD